MHTLEYRLVNETGAACSVRGYPRISLQEIGGKALPFTYVAVSSQSPARDKPKAVVIAAGAQAYILIANYRCDLGKGRLARAITVSLPGGETYQRQLDRTNTLTYCTQPGDTAGRTVKVSPIRATERELGPV